MPVKYGRDSNDLRGTLLNKIYNEIIWRSFNRDVHYMFTRPLLYGFGYPHPDDGIERHRLSL